MEIQAFLDREIMDELIGLIFKKSGKADDVSNGFSILKILSKMDSCLVQAGYWEKSNNKAELFRLLNRSGKSFHGVETNRFSTLIRNTDHFSLSLLSEENRKLINSRTPILSLEEIIRYINNFAQSSFSITGSKAQADFSKSSLTHDLTSVIINDRYLFADDNHRKIVDPVMIVDLILKNILSPDCAGNIIITLFYSNPKKKEYHVAAIVAKMREQLKKSFPNAEITLETPIETSPSYMSHDRFIVTDLLCYKSEKSFSFLTKNESTTIHRYALYDPENFKSNINYLTEFFKKSHYLIKHSKNPIIKSFISTTTS